MLINLLHPRHTKDSNKYKDMILRVRSNLLYFQKIYNYCAICLIKQTFLVWSKHTFYVLWPLPFLSVFREIRSLSPLKCAKRGGGIKDKMCVFTIRETFVLSSICQKCQGSEYNYTPSPFIKLWKPFTPFNPSRKPLL